jgi:hypothetical protein
VSRVRSAALRDLDGKAKPPERGKNAKNSIVAKEISICAGKLYFSMSRILGILTDQ